jgi:integrase
MTSIRINQKFVDSLKPDTKRKLTFSDTLLTGFMFVVYPSGKASYAANTRINGKLKRITLGKHPTLSANEARDKARPILQQMYEGIDPVKEQEKTLALAVAQSTTLRTIFNGYVNVRELKAGTKKDMANSLKYYLPDWMDKPIRAITRKDVENRFIDLRSKSGLPTADKAFRYLSAIMNFAKADETAGGHRLITENPCDVIKDKKFKRTSPARKSYLNEGAISILLEYAYSIRMHPQAPQNGVTDQGINYVLLLLLTGLRKSEAMSMKWADVDHNRDVFVIHDTKNGIDHYIPISLDVKTLLYRQKIIAGSSEWVFPARYGQGHMTEPKSQLAKINKSVNLDFTLHDLRRTFATHAKVNGADHDLIRRALNHKSGGSITDKYIVDRVDFLRPVFEAVAEQYAYYYHGGDGKAEYYDDGRVFDFMPDPDPNEPLPPPHVFKDRTKEG